MKNVNQMYKDKNRLFFACNNEGKNYPIYIAHTNGISKIDFTIQNEYTFVEFGFLQDDLMFVMYNEGEKAIVGCY